MAEFVRVASRGDVPAGEMLIVKIEGDEIVLANVGGEIFAFGNECTHRGGPLGEGLLEGEEVECPFHQGRFNVKTGEAVQDPPTEPVPTYRVQVEGDDILVAKG
jgi:3-phenylpropionate/trans-cinnamate dioxygenase ferredoxin subunit